ncbi:MAG: hypothetical protein CMQ02_08515 [Gammaproteobacteria bacterium]|nr:hypothetical protein [Gammaproteobacteria bacterium]
MTKIIKTVAELLRGKHLRKSALVAALFILGSMGLNAALPDSFDHVISHEGESYTASLSFFSNRGPNFQVQKQKDDGTFDVLEVPIVRTYIGMVQGAPGATVSAVRFDSGLVFYRAVFEDGREWINTGGRTDLLCDKGPDNTCVEPDLKFPEFVVGEGGAGSLIYGVEVGVDMPFHQFDGVHANDIVAALSIIEYSVNTTNALYMREAGIKHELGRVILRASRALDPYHIDQVKPASCAGSCVIDDIHFSRRDELKNQWENVLPGEKTHDVALTINKDWTMNGGAGLAELAKVGNPRGYSTNDTTEGVGDFSRVWRHEVGHNWGNGHYTGNAPEGGTIMSNNNLGRFSGPEQKIVLDIKKANLDNFASLGALKLLMAPNASLDSILAAIGSDTVIDVLGNDHDANGDEIFLVDVDKTSYLGASVQISEGKGAGGRDAITYRSGKLSLTKNVDRFKYRIRDSSGLESVGYAYIKVGGVAGTFKQDFNAQPDGTPVFTDGSTATGLGPYGSKPSISNGALQLTPDQTWSSSSYTVPKINLENGFTAKFKVKISSSTSLSADGFALNFGESIPTQTFSGNNFGGYAKGLTIEFNTFSKKGYRIFVNDEEIPNSYVADATLVDGKWRDVSVEWLAPGSLSLSINGVSIISNLSTSLFVPARQDQISFSAQTRGYSHEVLLDDVEVSNLFGSDTKTTHGSGEYEIVGTPMTWSDAAAYAKSKGATLVKIKTAEQNAWVKDLLKNVNTVAPDGGGAIYSWLGGTDSATEGSWLWEDDTEVPLNNSGTVWWGNGPGHGSGGSEPDNFGGTQHCLAMGLSGWPTASPNFYGSAGQWNDINCTNQLRFAIQYPTNVSPTVSIVGGSRSIADTDDKAGESVSLTATASDSDGTIVSTEWSVAGSKVASGLNAKIFFPNGSTTVTFTATDNSGASTSVSATITIPLPQYVPTDKWPSPYNGSTPDPSVGLAYNNIGAFNSNDSTIYTCLGLFANGLPSSANGISQFDIGLQVVSASDATVQITKLREFNIIGALNENAQSPDCSGVFETTTGLYTDVIEVSNSILETTWTLIDANNLILKLTGSKVLGAN